MSGLTAVSLFAGIEGIGLALERAGVTVVASAEIGEDCRGVLACQFPGVPQFSDVTEVTSEQLIAAGFVPGRGIITAGFPCQDLSIAGRRAGLGGARSGLFWHVVRLADELRPRWLLLENVPGLLSAVCSCPGDDACTANGRAVRCGRWDKRDGKRVWLAHVPHGPDGGACRGGCMPAHGGAMGTVLGALGNLGYGFAWRVLDAQFFGVPQRRSRVFIVGCLGDRAAPVEVLLEPESGARHSAARRPARASAARTTSASAGDTRTVGTLGGSGPGGGWRVGSDEAAAGQLIPLLEVNGRSSDRGTTRDGTGVGGDGDPMFTLQAGKQHGIAIPVQDGRGLEKDQNGLGLGDLGDPAYTLDTTGGQAVATLQGGGKRGHRIDAEGAAGGHLILSQNGSDIQTGSQLGALTAGMARQTSGDLIAFDTVQITHGENRSNPQPGDPSPTLNGNGATCTSPLPLSVGDTSAAITAHHGKGPDSDATNGLVLTGSPGSLALPAIAHAITRREGKGADSDATSGIVAAPIAFANQHRVEFSDLAQPVTGSHGQPGGVASGLAVRRLTPKECERLQGLPDDWTRWKLVNGELVEQSDSARYRQIGNSVAVPCVAWITGRIAAYDAATAEREAS